MGGTEEFVALFEAEHPRLVALGLALTGDAELARDLAQETLARAYTRWATLASHPNVAAWLRRVLVNALTDRRRHEVLVARTLPRLAPAASGEPEVAGDEWWTAVRRLPDRQRTAVALYYLEDWSVAEVAAAMDVTAGTVKATLAGAREALRRALRIEEEA